ncbi:MAG: hypothetical protein M2R45_00566 [Verrucomicrobia subdivision 3 bacterium]|nr:hypothetical protein [Limisphaerales bacterium]MCS1413556.1 hypothetical protein [Limisphaerales bacterium]
MRYNAPYPPLAHFPNKRSNSNSSPPRLLYTLTPSYPKLAVHLAIAQVIPCVRGALRTHPPPQIIVPIQPLSRFLILAKQTAQIATFLVRYQIPKMTSPGASGTAPVNIASTTTPPHDSQKMVQSPTQTNPTIAKTKMPASLPSPATATPDQIDAMSTSF